MNIIVSGGGTGGHIYPAIAIAEEFKRQEPRCSVLFVGGSRGMEKSVVERSGIPMRTLDISGLRRSLTPKNIGVAIKTVRAVGEAKRILDELEPDAVIGTGGYACFPILYAAGGRGIYTALHESNATLGLAGRMLLPRLMRVFCGFEACAESLGEKGKFVGSPIRGAFEAISKEEARRSLGLCGRYRYLIVSFGGSLGARGVNGAALEIMERLSCKRSDVYHIHACGRAESASFFAEFKEKGLDRYENISAREYIYDMPTVLAAADVAVCRSGAMTLAELSARGVPSVLIPSPNVSGDHQRKNALVFEGAGAAFLMDERTRKPDSDISGLVSELLADEKKRLRMGENAASLAGKGASERLVSEVMQSIYTKN